MPRNRSKSVSEDSGPVPHYDEFGSDQPTMADLYRMIIESFDTSDNRFDELTEEMRETRHY